ncbi:unnamed protein product [Rotaria socialis]
MNKTFRCGRLMLTKDGILKKLELENGGGSRRCNWDHNDMDFNTVQQRLMDVFHLNNGKYKTWLYDFERKLLDVHKYEKFSQYMNDHGLSGRSTIIYICTNEVNENENDDDDDPIIIMPNKKSTATMKKLKTEPKSSTSVRTNRSPRTVESQYILYDEDRFDKEQSSQSLFAYSFSDSINKLRKNIHDLIKNSILDETLVKLFENIQTISGMVCATIDPLKEKMKQSNQYVRVMNENEIWLNENNLTQAMDVCKSTKTLLELKKKQYGHIQTFSTVVNLFTQFYDNLQILLKQWSDNVEDNNEKYNTSTLSSCSTHSNNKYLSSDSHIQPLFQHKSELYSKNCKRQSQTSSIPVSQSLPSVDVFQPVSSFQESSNKNNQEDFALLESVLNCLNHLSGLLYPQYLSTFREFIHSAIDDIESIRSTINLHDEQSLQDAQKKTLSIKSRINKIIYEQDINYSKHGLDGQLLMSCKKTLKSMELLLISLDRYQIQLDQNNRRKHSNWSSPPRLFIDQHLSESRQTFSLKKRKSLNFHDDN